MRDIVRALRLYVAIWRAMHHLVVLGSERELAGAAPSLWTTVVEATVGKQRKA